MARLKQAGAMHEIGLMQQTLALAFSELEAHSAGRVLTLRLKAGPLSGVVKDSLEFAFEALSPGTPAEGARLEIEQPGIVCYCSQCRREREMNDLEFVCPACGGTDLQIRSGAELELTSMEIA